jgi:gamma-glutamyl hercynylcysteine S-oxide synthase
VTGVSWWEARAYARFVNKELPTEAHWEYAARGTDERLYPWGDEPPTSDHATFAAGCEPDELRRRATPIYATCRGISPFGVRDMAGNLFEWCLDNASLHYAWDITRRNPLYWTDECDDHVARGGSGLHNEDYLRCAARDYYPPELRDNIFGIRLVDNRVGAADYE